MATAAMALSPAAKLTLSQYAQMFIRGADVSGAGGSGLGGPDRPYQQSLWFNRCVSVKAGNLARVPLRVSVAEAAATRALWGLKHVRAGRINARSICRYKGLDAAPKAREGEILESGELVDFVARPNPEQRWNDFIRATAINLDVHGRVHWLFDEMAGRRPITMYVIPGAKSSPIVSKAGRVERLAGWKFRAPQGGEYPVALDECITFQIYDPYDPHGALSPRVPGNLAIISDYNASMYNAAMFANSCEPGTVLSTDVPYNPELDAQMKTTWAQRHQGPLNARRLAILWGGLKHDSVAQTLQEMVFAEGKQLSREEICAICDVPASVAGFLATPGRSEAFVQEELKRFWQDTIGPMLDGFADAVDNEICPRFDIRLEAWFDLESVPVFQDLRRSQISTVKDMWAMGVPLADLDDWCDLGLPERTWHQRGFLPISIQTAEEAVEGQVLPPLAEGEEAAHAQLTARAGTRDSSRVSGDLDESLVKAAAERVWRAWEKSWAPLAKRQAAMYAARGAAQCRLVRKLLADEPHAHLSAHAGTRDSSRVDVRGAKAPADIVARILVEVFDDASELGKFRGRLEKFQGEASKLGVEQTIHEAALPAEAAQTARVVMQADPAIAAAIRSDALRFSTVVDGATRGQLRRTLIEGMDAGETARELTDRVQAVSGQARGRALTTARNSVGQAMSRARHRTRQAAGVFTHEIWIHSRGPGERRPAHVAAEAEYAAHPKPLGQRWVINGAELDHPRDPAGPPAEIVNCQCLAVGRRMRPAAHASRDIGTHAGTLDSSSVVLEDLQNILARGFAAYSPTAEGAENAENRNGQETD